MTNPDARVCGAVLNIAGAHYGCDLDAPHAGLAHSNRDAQALWCSDHEAQIAKNAAVFDG